VLGHGGETDLMFPHHENEIAQSEGAHGVDFARVWLHNGHINMGGEKMSKSLGNLLLITGVLERYPPEVFRLFMVGAHYRSQVDYSQAILDEAAAVWERFRAFLRVAPSAEIDDAIIDAKLTAFGEAMDDDLNTPVALAALHELVREGHSAIEKGEMQTAAVVRAAVVRGLGVLGIEPNEDADRSDVVGPLVELLLEQREAARAAKDFARADAIRDRLTDIGVVVEDSPQGARWFLK
jgi:cysteinyl-tRNA synthetase